MDWEEFEMMLRLEREWKESLPRFTDRELLEIFPEAKYIFTVKMTELMEERERIHLAIRRRLAAIKNSISDEASRQIQKNLLEILNRSHIEKINRHIKWLERLQFIAQKRKIKGGVTDEEIQHALATPIQDVLKQKFQKSGNKLIGLCPFHKEKTPSFYIYTRNNSFYCYGCQTGGDAINLIRKLHNLNFVQAVKCLINA